MELRWYYDGVEERLQYRTVELRANLASSPVWSDWQDVPKVYAEGVREL